MARLGTRGDAICVYWSTDPSMLHAHKKPPLSTGLVITTGVATITFVYVTLGFWGSAIASGLHAVQWAIVAYQRYVLDKVQN